MTSLLLQRARPVPNRDSLYSTLKAGRQNDCAGACELYRPATRLGLVSTEGSQGASTNAGSRDRHTETKRTRAPDR